MKNRYGGNVEYKGQLWRTGMEEMFSRRSRCGEEV